MRVSGGSYVKETSWAISARVLTRNVPFMLMTIGMMTIFALSVP